MSLKTLFKPFRKYLYLYVVIVSIQTYLNLKMPELITNIMKVGILQNDQSNIYKNGALMALLASLVFLCSYIGLRILVSTTFKFIRNARYEMYKKFQAFSSLDIHEHGISSYITRLTNDIDQVSNVILNTTYLMISAPTILIGATFMTLKINKEVAYIFLGLIPLMGILVLIIMMLSTPKFKAQRHYTDKINKLTRESIVGIRVIRAFNKENHEVNRFQEANKGYSTNLFDANKIIAIFPTFIPLIANLSSILVLTFGSYLMDQQELNVEYLIPLQQYGIQVVIGLIMISFGISMLPQAMIARGRINEMLAQEIKNPDVNDGQSLESIQHITFDHVTTQLPNAEYPIIHDISFDIQRGQTLGITGSTGSGKTSIINALMRLFKETSGHILINHQDINTYDVQSLRARISYVPQVKRLFKGTIRSNMTFANPEASDKDIMQALKLACADEFVMNLEHGLDAIVEQNGENFSGGQKQRLCMARAFIKPADVYIFDDSFSALDYQTEANIRQQLNEYKKDSIKIIISQRASSIANADHVLFLEEGALITQGTHETLKQTNTRYQAIFADEFKGDLS